MDIVLMIMVVLTAGFSVFYSFKTRSYRKTRDYNLMKYYNAKANIAMGIMLVAMGCIQLFTFAEDTSGWRIGVGLVFLFLGIFNLFMGTRNYQIYMAELKKK